MLKTFFLLIIIYLFFACNQIENHSTFFIENAVDDFISNDSTQYYLLHKKANQCKLYCTKNNYNNEFCLLINLSKHSGKKRFYLWDFAKDRAIDSGMVSHGCYTNPWGQTLSKEKAICSNVENSHASSLGNYIIGERGISEWGIKTKYTLYGLDKTNNNALKRFIVLHSWDDVSEEEVYPNGTPEGWGCPATSNDFLKRIDIKLRNSQQKVLLNIFQ